jgi:hypothetical protein
MLWAAAGIALLLAVAALIVALVGAR